MEKYMASELKNLMEHSPDILAVFDRDLRILDINREGALHLGFPLNKIEGKKITELLGETAQDIDHHVRQAFEKGLPVSALHEVPTTYGLHCFNAIYTPLPDKSGSVDRVFGIWRDTTDETAKMRKLEEVVEARALVLNEKSTALSQDHIFSSAILETVKALIAVLDNEGIIIRQNSSFEKLTGLSNTDTKGKSFLALFSLADLSGAPVSSFADLAGYHSVREYENHWKCADEASRYFTWSVVPIFDENGSVEFYIATGIDITEKKLAEEALSKARQEFISILTHDLKAPLASVMGFMDLMERSLCKEKMTKEQEYSALIRHSCNVMLNLIQNIVESSRIDSQKFTFHYDIFQLKELISELRKSYSPLTDREHITLDFRVPDDIIVKADNAKMRQVFNNLLSNALRFTPRNGTISIIANKDGNRAMVQVADNGKGIPRQEQEFLFQKFSQARGERHGTGLGLYIVRNILEGHGSEVKMKSAPGEGTSFFFSLPLA